jgi:hypothetical protein
MSEFCPAVKTDIFALDSHVRWTVLLYSTSQTLHQTDLRIYNLMTNKNVLLQKQLCCCLFSLIKPTGYYTYHHV